MRASCSAGVSPSGLLTAMPARSWPLRPATRTMKNSSRLLAEIDRNRTRSSRGWASFAASSSTRRLNWSHDNSRLMNRSGLAISSKTGAASALAAIGSTPASSFITMTLPRSAMDQAADEECVVGRRHGNDRDRVEAGAEIADGERHRGGARREQHESLLLAREIEKVEQRPFVECAGGDILDHQRAGGERRWHVCFVERAR